MKYANKYILILFFFSFCTLQTLAQTATKEIAIDTPYYLFPINPGQVNYLAGTMGELRATHFHGGIDIKTGGREGLNVYSSADGYVSRVKVSSGGYGNVVYIQHPNGYTTTYAHLQKFYPTLAQYVREQQYETQTFDVDIFPSPSQFRVSRGQVIGISGNTGGSSGPHLHYEIRDQKQRSVNPLNEGFSEIKDHIPPTAQEIALVCLDPDARINGQYGRFEFPVTRQGKNFRIFTPITVYGNVGVEFKGYDKLDGVSNQNGIPIVSLSRDSTNLYAQNLTHFAFSDSRQILAHTNYQARRQGSGAFNKLYIEDGDHLDIYNRNLGSGSLQITDTLSHEVVVNLVDAYKNQSQISFQLKGEKPTILSNQKGKIGAEGYRLDENSLVIVKDLTLDPAELLEIYYDRRVHTLIPSYFIDQKAVYVWDLRKGIPDSANLCHKMIHFGFKAVVPPTSKFDYYNTRFDLHISPHTAFDTLYLQTFVDSYLSNKDTEFMEKITIGDPSIPLLKNYSVDYKPMFIYPFQERTHAYKDNGSYFSYVGGTWQNNKINFRTRDFGSYVLLTDTLKPTIRPIHVSSAIMEFVIRDSRSGIKSWSGYINDQWILFNYDYKRNLIWSEKLDPAVPFKGTFRLEVEDNAGNKQEYLTELR